MMIITIIKAVMSPTTTVTSTTISKVTITLSIFDLFFVSFCPNADVTYVRPSRFLYASPAGEARLSAASSALTKAKKAFP